MATSSDSQASRARRRLPGGAAEAGIGRQAAIATVAAEFVGEARMQREAPPRQPLKRTAVAPVERQEPARLAGGTAGDRHRLDYHRRDAAGLRK